MAKVKAKPVAHKRCFVISPIGAAGSEARKHANEVFKGIIRPAFDLLQAEDGLSILPIRSDQLNEPGLISEQMYEGILRHDLCLALLSGSNPNVFFELAVALCAYRPVVMLLEEGSVPPFDVKDMRLVTYVRDTERMLDRTDARLLAASIRDVLSPAWKPPNPFGDFAPELWAGVRNRKSLRELCETIRPKPLEPGVDAVFEIPPGPDQTLSIITGGIHAVDGVDVIVSSENTDLQLARAYDPAISGMLRYLDAERGANRRILRDALHEKLQERI
jgi:hypothetical protein